MIKEVEFNNYRNSVAEALNGISAAEKLRGLERVVIKPNLIFDAPPPITTPIECIAAIIEYLRHLGVKEIIIAEGCGAPEYETEQVFQSLGYRKYADESGVELVDLNQAETVKLEREDCAVFPHFYMPKLVLDNYLISVPVLKAHSLARVTGSMKNMIGVAPPEHYQAGGHWRKAVFHSRMQQAIIELNRYRTPDLTVLDARVGMAEYHLGGPECDPPVNKIICGFDPQEVDRRAAELLGFDPNEIIHLVDR